VAFSTSNIVRENLGSVNAVRGNWAGLNSDATIGTYSGSGSAFSAEFLTNNTVGPENAIPCRILNSNGTWTVSVPYTTDVTNGSFIIKFK